MESPPDFLIDFNQDPRSREHSSKSASREDLVRRQYTIRDKLSRSTIGCKPHEEVTIYGENYWQKQAESLMMDKKSHLIESHQVRLELKDLLSENRVLKDQIRQLRQSEDAPEPCETQTLQSLLEEPDESKEETK